jgi:hypothetical protein
VLVAPAGGTIRLVATDGARTAVVSTVGSQSTLTLTGVTTKPWRVPVPLSTYAVTFSGHRLLVADEQSSGAAAFKARSRVLDLSRPTVHWTTEPDLSAISGSLLAYQLNDGSIWLRNLDLPRTHDKRLLPPAPGNDRRVDHGQINISGDWVTWTNWGVGGSTQSGAYRLSTGKVLARPNPRSVLAEGMAAYADDNLAVHLVDLARGTDTPVPGAFSQGGLSLSDDVLSYVDVDNDTVLVPVGSLVAAAPRAVQVSGDTVRVAPVTTKKPLLATYEVSRPLTTWTFAVRSSKGTVVFRTKGSAPTGWLRVAWNGRGSKGRHLPAGRYTWTVTGSGPGGALTGPSGKGKLHGVVRL